MNKAIHVVEILCCCPGMYIIQPNNKYKLAN